MSEEVKHEKTNEHDFKSKEFLKTVDDLDLTSLVKNFTGESIVLKQWYTNLKLFAEKGDLNVMGKKTIALLTFPITPNK